VRNRCLDEDLLLSDLKHLVADLFRPDLLAPDEMADDEPLLGGSLCLDSTDVLELALCAEEEFGIALCNGELLGGFITIASLADLIHARAQTSADNRLRPTGLARTRRSPALAAAA